MSFYRDLRPDNDDNPSTQVNPHLHGFRRAFLRFVCFAIAAAAICVALSYAFANAQDRQSDPFGVVAVANAVIALQAQTAGEIIKLQKRITEDEARIEKLEGKP